MTYTLDQLAAETGVSPSRIRKWIYRGIVPHAIKPPEGGRPHYTIDHVKRIREILDILDRNMTLADLYDYFHPLTEDEEDALDELMEAWL